MKIHLALLALLLAIPLTVAARDQRHYRRHHHGSGWFDHAGRQVTARNVDTGLTRTVNSSDVGAYRLEFLPVGNYAIEVTAAGFKEAYIPGIVLQVNDTARLMSPSTVGHRKRNRHRDDPAVNTSTAEIGRTIQSAGSLRCRWLSNVYTLLDLTPGVQSNNGIAAASTGTSTFILSFPEQRTLINGGTDGGTGSVNYYLDGGSNA